MSSMLRSMMSLLALTATANAAAPTKPSLVSLVEGNTDLTTLLSLVVNDKSVLDAVSKGNLTLFAPTDEAFGKLAPSVLATITKSPALIESTLETHVISGVLDAKALLTAGSAKSLEGEKLMIKQDSQTKTVTVDESVVIAPNLMASNGIVHLIDYVIVPKTAALNTNVMGVAAQAYAGTRTLSELIVKAGLETALANEKSKFTVFAPTDAAFELLSIQLFESVVHDMALLTSILKYHVVGNNVITNGTPVATLNTAAPMITYDEDAKPPTVYDAKGNVLAKVTATVKTTSGLAVIHLVDRVMIPPTKN